jgi:hypothetical protein
MAFGILALLAIGCAPGGSDKPRITNTGYVGTWARGGDVRSRIAIVRVGEDYRVRWNLRSSDDKRRVECTWEGSCEEFVNGERVAEFKLTPSVDGETGNLWIECDGEVFKPEEATIHFKDELVLRPKGRKLVAHTIEEGESTWVRGEGQPRRIFEKESDSVADPPPSVGG